MGFILLPDENTEIDKIEIKKVEGGLICTISKLIYFQVDISLVFQSYRICDTVTIQFLTHLYKHLLKKYSAFWVVNKWIDRSGIPAIIHISRERQEVKAKKKKKRGPAVREVDR